MIPSQSIFLSVTTMMMRAAILTMLFATSSTAMAESLPEIRRNGEAIQLIVDGTPYLALAGELHNSSPSSPAYMAPIWDKLAKHGVRTVIGAASWELVERQEGNYDFTAVDDQIKQAQVRGMRLVMIWFGAYKNASSTYAPSWVRRDEARFPRTIRDPTLKPTGLAARLGVLPHVSVFSDKLVQADARAFAALMAHIRQVDRDRTIIMVQVENEVGLLADSRDRSSLAEAAWQAPVPPALIRYLRENTAKLHRHLREAWERNGARERGTWAEVFGTDKVADEIFMAWGFGQYVDQVARAGAAEYRLPMFANAWLGPQPNAADPGDYPSGGPVARMIDVWKAAAPSLALLAPDIYIEDLPGVLAEYKRPDNAVFIPEARNDASNIFVSIGQFNAIAFSPFGIEDENENSAVFKAYKVLNGMAGQITKAQAEGRIRGFKIKRGGQFKDNLAGYDLEISGPRSTVGAFGAGTGTEAASASSGYGLVITSGPEEFLVVGRGITINFSKPGATVEVDEAEEGVFTAEQWRPGRTLNGDERFYLFPTDDLRIVRIKLLTR